MRLVKENSLLFAFERILVLLLKFIVCVRLIKQIWGIKRVGAKKMRKTKYDFMNSYSKKKWD